MIRNRGVEYPVHPLDLTVLNPVEFPSGSNGTLVNATACMNAYTYISSGEAEFGYFDIVLGDSFLRNVYAS